MTSLDLQTKAFEAVEKKREVDDHLTEPLEGSSNEPRRKVMRMMQPNELSVVDVRPLPDSRSRLAEHGGDSLIQVSSSTGPSPGLDNTFFDRYDPAPSSIVLEDLGHPDVPPLRLPPVPPGCPLLRRCKIDLYG